MENEYLEKTIELEEIEFIARKLNRSEYLIAQFIDGYAIGWAFPVKEAFRDALDIKKTNKTINKKVFQIYTQGQNFNFEQGDSFYNDKSAYDDWLTFLKGENPICLQVHSSTSSGFETKTTVEVIETPISILEYTRTGKKEKDIKSLKVLQQSFNPGNIIIEVYRPNEEKLKIAKSESLTLKQDEFVKLLQRGMVYDKDQEKFISFKFRS